MGAGPTIKIGKIKKLFATKRPLIIHDPKKKLLQKKNVR